MSHEPLPLGEPDVWPTRLTKLLDEHREVFLNWEVAPDRVGAPFWDTAIMAVAEALSRYSITGWHCTRLTDAEIGQIIASGKQLPDGAMLRRRIEALVLANLLPGDVAGRLQTVNQADDSNRAGMLWFCFFPPRLAGEHGIGRFFRYWGGEALYNLHEDDAATSQLLRAIGTPCLVEADVPVSALKSAVGLAIKLVRRDLIRRGDSTEEPSEHEDRCIQPLAATCIRRVIRGGDPEFATLTGGHAWLRPPDTVQRGMAAD
ncbi:hypothetical protein [Paraburkholderia sp. MM5384-R2]|uniref:hypothetical protein n=1 Tax=Paraburkholderia sp. MM5384-R2 TaxID=2723097 RepID=UPI0016099CF4|nr:hypothetical protein [Paraburkholderia sp. MM5384-R2]MBB5498679.1 hypothetical protein [Paraburkholderia sp. MM5384-R2]